MYLEQQVWSYWDIMSNPSEGVFGMKNLRNDKNHCKSCHERWSGRLNRNMDSSGYLEEWYTEQCGGCIFFIPLIGYLSDDWGVCSNAKSPFDGNVRFEHDGCEKYLEGEWT